MVSGTPRPVAIEVPADLWARPAPGAVGSATRTMPTVDLDAVDAAAAKLRGAANPLIWVGTGAQDAAQAVRSLAEMLQAPVSTRRMGHGVLDETDPLFVPIGLAHRLWADADLVLGIGSRIEFPLLTWGTTGLDLIQINTDADELDRHGIGALGMHGDAGRGRAAAARTAGRPGTATGPSRRASQHGGLDFYADIAHLEPQLVVPRGHPRRAARRRDHRRGRRRN